MTPLAYKNLKFLYEWNLVRFGEFWRNLNLNMNLNLVLAYSDTRGVTAASGILFCQCKQNGVHLISHPSTFPSQPTKSRLTT
jgi:hypothetical protein